VGSQLQFKELQNLKSTLKRILGYESRAQVDTFDEGEGGRKYKIIK
jgi:hypothetical protein